MKVPTYSNKEEKSSFFNIIEINSIDDFNDVFKIHKDSKGLYRGISNASYKIYTSLQRKVMLDNLSKNFSIETYIKNASKNPILSKYFYNTGVLPSKISIFSFLQHYGAPTPILDFTTNFETALYFAIEKYISSSFVATGDLEDYLSIFFIEENDKELIAIPEVIQGLQNMKKYTIDAMSSYEEYSMEYVTEHIDRMLDINTCDIFLIENNEDFRDIYNTHNNIRIIAQEGLFVYNNHLDKPLEAALPTFFDDYTIYQPDLTGVEDEHTEEREEEYQKRLEKIRSYHKRLSKNIITSFDIHKSLIPNILLNFKLTKDDIYPDPEKLSWKIFESSIKK